MSKLRDGILLGFLKDAYAPQIAIYEGIASLINKNPEEKETRAFQARIQRDEAKAELAQTMAKVQQELAIASRIATADEVEIEEYYEGAGKGTIGASVDEKAVTLGISGEGRRITKRILRFKGWRDASSMPNAVIQMAEEKKNDS